MASFFILVWLLPHEISLLSLFLSLKACQFPSSGHFAFHQSPHQNIPILFPTLSITSYCSQRAELRGQVFLLNTVRHQTRSVSGNASQAVSSLLSSRSLSPPKEGRISSLMTCWHVHPLTVSHQVALFLHTSSSPSGTTILRLSHLCICSCICLGALVLHWCVPIQLHPTSPYSSVHDSSCRSVPMSHVPVYPPCTQTLTTDICTT